MQLVHQHCCRWWNTWDRKASLREWQISQIFNSSVAIQFMLPFTVFVSYHFESKVILSCLKYKFYCCLKKRPLNLLTMRAVWVGAVQGGGGGAMLCQSQCWHRESRGWRRTPRLSSASTASSISASAVTLIWLSATTAGTQDTVITRAGHHHRDQSSPARRSYTSMSSSKHYAGR